MFQNISWSSYWTVIALISAGYYLSIYLLYFLKDFAISFPNKKSSLATTAIENKTNQPSLFETQDIAQGIESEERQAGLCLDEITAFFEAQKKTKPVKNELLYGLYHIAQKYPSLKASPYKETISNVIITEAENLCSTHISDEEMKGVWFG